VDEVIGTHKDKELIVSLVDPDGFIAAVER
jgi:hypothetical protein